MEIDPVTRFVSPTAISGRLDKMFAEIKKMNGLKGLAKSTFVDQIAREMTDLNIIHPFREGNGRSKRIFFKSLAKNAGYDLDWSKNTVQEWKFADECAFDSARDGKLDISHLKILLDKAILPIDKKSKNTNIQIDKPTNQQSDKSFTSDMEMEL